MSFISPDVNKKIKSTLYYSNVNLMRITTENNENNKQTQD